MNFVQLLQVVGVTALVTLALALLLLRLRATLRAASVAPPPSTSLPETAAGRTPPRCTPGTP
ncbi:cellulose biosynthesis protein BcsF [Pseudomonas sp. X4]|uniref:cellulose biosynthesis protein BcsF n=1 Tax=Pseudomonas sp. X4 TaxID=3231526 RepID=UPI0034614BCF